LVVIANVDLSSPILVTLIEEVHCSEMSVLITARRRKIPEDVYLQDKIFIRLLLSVNQNELSGNVPEYMFL
jgi:hypothetical protein